MKRRGQKLPATKDGDPTSIAALLARDGAMRIIVAVAGFLMGIWATHADLGRRVDELSAQVKELSARIDAKDGAVKR